MRLHMIAQMLAGEPASDIRRTLAYRPELFGQPFSYWAQTALRGPSYWSIGERELFAAFVSSLNRCRY